MLVIVVPVTDSAVSTAAVVETSDEVVTEDAVEVLVACWSCRFNIIVPGPVRVAVVGFVEA